MRVDCGELDPAAVIRPIRGEWHPRMPERLEEEELADWRAGRNAVYQLAALTIDVLRVRHGQAGGANMLASSDEGSSGLPKQFIS
jgi:hypothetical protein